MLNWQNFMNKGKITQVSGKGQGLFRYYKEDHTFQEIIALGGFLYDLKTGNKINIQALDTGFQTTRPIEAVQYGTKLYIATGTKLVEYDGTNAKVVEPYNPQPLEALYIGTNGLAEDPNNFISDGTGALAINAVIPDKRTGVYGQKTNFHIVVTKGSNDHVEFDVCYFNGTDINSGEKWIRETKFDQRDFDWTPPNVGDYTLRVRMYIVGDNSIKATYYIPKYTVKATDENKTYGLKGVQTCNRLMLYWDRLLMYGDTMNGSQIYVSNLNMPNYFPIPNIIDFKNEKQEAITSLLQYRDALIIFTSSTIQALTGKSPSDYQRMSINTSLGCIAPYSARLVGNDIMFLSSDGVYALISLRSDTYALNIQKVDKNIANIVPKDTDACAAFYDTQYHLFFPSRGIRLRYYSDYKVWTKDESHKLNFSNVYVWDSVMYGSHKDTGYVYRFDNDVYDDDGYVYEDSFETKQFDFGIPYHVKKLKELRVTARTQDAPVNLFMEVYADKTLALASPEGKPEVNSEGEVHWVNTSEGNVHFSTGTVVGSWELGRDSLGRTDALISKLKMGGNSYRTNVRVVHKDNTPNQIISVAYIFKQKKG